MKKIRRYLYYIILMVICPVLLGSLNVNAGVNDFYFEDFTGDYYLSRGADGVSRLKVVEQVTAVFPDYPQNKGICRQIPFTNQEGRNITLPVLKRENLELTRNGKSEPIYSIEKESNYYNVCTGTEEYVMGRQVYKFEYGFEKVVTDFSSFQELYWDTNGNGATQKFDRVVARVHLADDVINDFTGESWCYVGTFGAKGDERCEMTRTSDGMEFSAQNLASHENLTFDMEFEAGAFIVPGPVKDYTYVWLTVVVGVLCAFVIGRGIWKYVKSRDKEEYYKGLFVKPEYQPNSKYGLTEMVEVFLGKKKDVKVAMLLELVVKHKIEFQKVDKKKWKILVKNLDGVGEEYVDLLAILNGGTRPETGDEIELKSHSASNRLVSLRKSMESKVVRDLKQDKLVESKYNYGGSTKRGVANVVAMTIIMVPVVVMFGVFVLGILNGMLGLDEIYGKEYVFYDHFYLTVLIMITVTVPIVVWLSDKTQRYAGHTLEGLKASRYMDGLELYIKMAEAERIKMLQSVKGADTSAEGIVKLYEKLLPYAAVFGLEESWMDEMREYCKVEEIEEPDYLLNGIATYEIMRGLSRASSIASTSTVMSSSGGGSSSGFSGGGGGGFSGGGGGGGGFSGR